MDHLFPYPKMGHSFTEILEDPLTQKLLGHDAVHAEEIPFISGVTSRFTFLLSDATKHLSFLKIGYTALEAFLQANVTGPPLPFDSEPVVFPSAYRGPGLSALKQEMLQRLSVDGSAVYALTPRVELFWLAKTIMSNNTLAESGFNGRRARFRADFWHQKLLSEPSETLRDQIYADAEILEQQLGTRYRRRSAAAEEHLVEFLTERAAVRTFYGDDTKARDDLAHATAIRHFHFALTGMLGKRTKYQQNETSQLVVLAKSRDHEPEAYSSRKSSRSHDTEMHRLSHGERPSPSQSPQPQSPISVHAVKPVPSTASAVSDTSAIASPFLRPPESLSDGTAATQPGNLALNDDTLLEKISFTTTRPQVGEVSDGSDLGPELATLDVADQPQLFPMDSIILLAVASSVTNTSPSDGLTREETLPYATRVLEGGSSNWQVYTQALLVRSRIEGYRSRTAERGLLQLQALVDQVIAETTETPTTHRGAETGDQTAAPATFLPQATASESASVAERLKYIYQISPPFRWEMEAELAQRWTAMGGLRSALEIYRRLQMHAEVALCLAATDQEAEAIRLLENLLFEPASPAALPETLKLQAPQPADAPRLLCILGDIKQDPTYYALAWTGSDQRYARAQRSLGRYFARNREPIKAARAYESALKITRLDNSTWFALGCIQLELEDYAAAVRSFTRVVQLEDSDAEGWSNLAVALLRLPPDSSPPPPRTSASLSVVTEDEEAEDTSSSPNPLRHTLEALRALRRAANLKRDDARIWDNYMTVAASIPPSQGTPWNEIVQCMGRVITLRAPKQGEAAIDLKILEVLTRHITQSYVLPNNEPTELQTTAEMATANAASEAEKTDMADEVSPTTEQPQPRVPFIVRSFLSMVDKQITPLACTAQLFHLLSQLSLWRHRPAESLSYTEKAWRAASSTPGCYESSTKWEELAQRTEALVTAYRALGEMERERTGGLVEKSWKFKAKSAVRGVLGKAKENKEGSKPYKRLERVLEGLG